MQALLVLTGFHACRRDFALQLERGQVSPAEWRPSENRFDWLGTGIYFWEANQRRAEEWAHDYIDGAASIIEAEISVQRCLDITTTPYLDLIHETFESLVEAYASKGWKLPENRDAGRIRPWQRWLLAVLDRANRRLYSIAGEEFRRAGDKKLRFLDQLVIEQFLNAMENGAGEEPIQFQAVRCPFEEGKPLFPGSMIRRQTHIQISVRDSSCIAPRYFHHV